jgi:hypothetical protein
MKRRQGEGGRGEEYGFIVEGVLLCSGAIILI